MNSLVSLKTSRSAPIRIPTAGRWPAGVRMTMQIVIRGIDGLVLASDKKHRLLDTAITSGARISGTYDASKIVLCENHPIAIASAGSGEYLDETAERLKKHLDELSDVTECFDKSLALWGNAFYPEAMGAGSKQNHGIPF